MYHDEFARKPARRETFGENALPTVAMEVGGGLWMALAASLNQTTLALLFQLGGLLPLVACSFAIFARRCSETLARLAPTSRVPLRLPARILHLDLPSTALAGRRLQFVGMGSARVGHDDPGRLG